MSRSMVRIWANARSIIRDGARTMARAKSHALSRFKVCLGIGLGWVSVHRLNLWLGLDS